MLDTYNSIYEIVSLFKKIIIFLPLHKKIFSYK